MSNEANPRYLEALSFAVERHGNVRQPRKGTTFPYVIHPIRVAEILDQFGYREEVVVAGLLHDTIEDAGVSSAELSERFGSRVAALVEGASEPDKRLDWKTRKQHSIDRVAELDSETLEVVAADKLDNVRSLRETLRLHGKNETWKIFNADAADQHWYYRTMAQRLLDNEPTNLLFRTLDTDVHTVFPDERRTTRFFAGTPLGNPQDARAYLADPIKHWRPKYSAFELAAAWLTGDAVPAKVDALLRTAFGEYEIVEGFFEKPTKLDDFGRPSQTDLLLLVHSPIGLVVVGIEAKAKEPFGQLISEWKGNRRRLEGLCGRLSLDPKKVQHLRYQLLHRTVAAVLEAERYQAAEAIMLVHSFDDAEPSSGSSLEDYRSFAKSLGLLNADPDTLTSPKRLDGLTLRLGWVSQH